MKQFPSFHWSKPVSSAWSPGSGNVAPKVACPCSTGRAGRTGTWCIQRCATAVVLKDFRYLQCAAWWFLMVFDGDEFWGSWDSTSVLSTSLLKETCRALILRFLSSEELWKLAIPIAIPCSFPVFSPLGHDTRRLLAKGPEWQTIDAKLKLTSSASLWTIWPLPSKLVGPTSTNQAYFGTGYVLLLVDPCWVTKITKWTSFQNPIVSNCGNWLFQGTSFWFLGKR
jgi:hypothetical protein